MLAGIADNFPNALKQHFIIEDRLANLDAIAAKLTRVAYEAGGMCERTHRHWAVICGHTTKRALCDKRGPSAEVGGPKRGHHTGGPGPDHDDINHNSPTMMRSTRWAPS